MLCAASVFAQTDTTSAGSGAESSWFAEHWVAVALIVIGALEGIVRLLPTNNNLSMIDGVFAVLKMVLPNFKKNGGKFKTIAVLFITSALLQSCTTYEKCYDKFSDRSVQLQLQEHPSADIHNLVNVKGATNVQHLVFPMPSLSGFDVQVKTNAGSDIPGELTVRSTTAGEQILVKADCPPCPPSVIFQDKPASKQQQERRTEKFERRLDRKDVRAEHGGWIKRTWTGYANMCGIAVMCYAGFKVVRHSLKLV